MTSCKVESAPARYQPQRGIPGDSVNSYRREFRFQVLAHTTDTENSGDPVGERHIDHIAGPEGSKAEEDSRPRIGVYVALDDRYAVLTGCFRILVPCRLTRGRVQ